MNNLFREIFDPVKCAGVSHLPSQPSRGTQCGDSPFYGGRLCPWHSEQIKTQAILLHPDAPYIPGGIHAPALDDYKAGYDDGQADAHREIRRMAREQPHDWRGCECPPCETIRAIREAPWEIYDDCC